MAGHGYVSLTALRVSRYDASAKLEHV